MYTTENLKDLLGRRFVTSLDNRHLFIHYSKLWNTWGIYLAGEKNPVYHSSLEHISAEKICEWLNNPNYTVTILPGFFG